MRPTNLRNTVLRKLSRPFFSLTTSGIQYLLIFITPCDMRGGALCSLYIAGSASCSQSTSSSRELELRGRWRSTSPGCERRSHRLDRIIRRVTFYTPQRVVIFFLFPLLFPSVPPSHDNNSGVFFFFHLLTPTSTTHRREKR